MSGVLRLPGGGAVERPRAAAVGAHLARSSTARWPGSAGIGDSELRELARLSYIKVVEFQRRGLVHLHVVAPGRRGGGTGRAAAALARHAVLRPRPSRRPSPGPAWPCPRCAGTALRRARWGAQVDVRVLDPVRERRPGRPSPPTWPSTPPRRPTARRGWPIRSAPGPSSSASGSGPTSAPWCARAWDLGRRQELGALRLRAHAHTLGYRGQFSSKSLRYSTTFGALRAARADYVRGRATRTTSTSTASGATPAGATTRPRPSELARNLHDAAPRGSPNCPQMRSRNRPQSHELGKHVERNFCPGTIGERFGNLVGEGRWHNAAMTTPPRPVTDRHGRRRAGDPRPSGRLAAVGLGPPRASWRPRRAAPSPPRARSRPGPPRPRGRARPARVCSRPSWRRCAAVWSASACESGRRRGRSWWRVAWEVVSGAGADPRDRSGQLADAIWNEVRRECRAAPARASRSRPGPTTSTWPSPRSTISSAGPVSWPPPWPLACYAPPGGRRGRDPHGGAPAVRGGRGARAPLRRARKERHRAEQALRPSPSPTTGRRREVV